MALSTSISKYSSKKMQETKKTYGLPRVHKILGSQVMGNQQYVLELFTKE